MRPYCCFVLNGAGIEVIDLAEILSVFGESYEHQIFHRPPANTALIWGGVISLWIAAAVGTVTCITAFVL